MKSLCMLLLFARAILGAVPADFTGTWKVKYAGPPNTGPKTIGSMIFDFKVDAGKVTGMARIGSWPGYAPIADGKIDGDRISFTATGHLPSTTGVPTCLLNGNLSGGELAIQLSTIRNPGGPGSGGVYEYRGARIDTQAALAEKRNALVALSMPRSFTGYPEPDPPPPSEVDSNLRQRSERLAAHIAEWESVKPHPNRTQASAFTEDELDDLIAFYNSPAGQSMIRASRPSEEIKLAVAQFIAR